MMSAERKLKALSMVDAIEDRDELEEASAALAGRLVGYFMREDDRTWLSYLIDRKLGDTNHIDFC